MADGNGIFEMASPKIFLMNDKKHAHETHDRWAKKLPSNRNFDAPGYVTPGLDNEQCELCQYYIKLSGNLGLDWGVCSNARSKFDGTVMFEHDGCEEYSFAEDAPELNPDIES